MSIEEDIRSTRTTSTKWMKYPPDIVPAWIADMDLGIAPAIAEELTKHIQNGDLGYPCADIESKFLNAFADRYLEHFNTPLDPTLALTCTDVVQSIYTAILTLTQPGEGIIVQTPIYPPFLQSVKDTGRTLCENPLIRQNETWKINLDELGLLARDPNTTMLLLCSPHNPTGRVFTQEELVQIADVCGRNNVVVISDEIHSDIVYDPNFHIPFASISPHLASNVITMTSATKSFNIAGLRCSVVHFGSLELKSRYEKVNPHVRGSVSTLSMLAATSAWTKGDGWLTSTLATLRANRDTITKFVERESHSGLKFIPPQGTYLAWLDFRETKASQDTHGFLLQHARVGLSPGSDFGTPGTGWARLNFATKPEILDDILNRISMAIS